METKEVKIQAPEGYEIDKENSTFECIKFKPIEIRNVNAADTIRTKLFNEYKEKEGIKSDLDFKNAFNKFLIKYCKN